MSLFLLHIDFTSSEEERLTPYYMIWWLATSNVMCSDVHFPALARTEHKHRKTDYKTKCRLEDNIDIRHNEKKLKMAAIGRNM